MNQYPNQLGVQQRLTQYAAALTFVATAALAGPTHNAEPELQSQATSEQVLDNAAVFAGADAGVQEGVPLRTSPCETSPLTISEYNTARTDERKQVAVGCLAMKRHGVIAIVDFRNDYLAATEIAHQATDEIRRVTHDAITTTYTVVEPTAEAIAAHEATRTAKGCIDASKPNSSPGDIAEGTMPNVAKKYDAIVALADGVNCNEGIQGFAEIDRDRLASVFKLARQYPPVEVPLYQADTIVHESLHLFRVGHNGHIYQNGIGYKEVIGNDTFVEGATGSIDLEKVLKPAALSYYEYSITNVMGSNTLANGADPLVPPAQDIVNEDADVVNGTEPLGEDIGTDWTELNPGDVQNERYSMTYLSNIVDLKDPTTGNRAYFNKLAIIPHVTDTLDPSRLTDVPTPTMSVDLILVAGNAAAQVGMLRGSTVSKEYKFFNGDKVIELIIGTNKVFVREVPID